MPHTPKGFLALLTVCILSLSVGSTVAQQQGDVRAAIEAAEQQFVAAFSRGDSAALADLYTPNGQLFPAHSDIVSGKQAIEQFWQGVLKSGVKRAMVTTLEVDGHGDTAFEVGKYTLVGEGDKVLDAGKYVVIWKQNQGQWKLHRDIWTTNMPTPGQ
jgi:uncharacterized protein (TIGR02246 family)